MKWTFHVQRFRCWSFFIYFNDFHLGIHHSFLCWSILFFNHYFSHPSIKDLRGFFYPQGCHILCSLFSLQKIFHDYSEPSEYTPQVHVFPLQFCESHYRPNKVYFWNINFLSTLIKKDTLISCKWLLICSTTSLWSLILYYIS